MSLSTYTSTDTIPDQHSVTYFQKGYFQSQDYNQLVAYSNEQFFVAFDITPEMAISIPRSPFGSFFCRNDVTTKAEAFVQEVEAKLKEQGAKQVEIHHPSPIYNSFIPSQSLRSFGFNTAYTDINQHIDLTPEWETSIHKMQRKKLKLLKKEGFEFRKMESDQLEVAHKFLTICRQAQGLQINISWEQLKNLNDNLPNVYECFGVFREEKISALCISVNVTSEVVYYYLPATSPMFRDKSPMVLLIAGMVEYYRERGFKYFDLGVSSHHGKPQETLRLFKERMGAKETSKPTFLKTI